MGEFDYVTVLDSDVGTRMSGGGHVIVFNAGEAPSEVFKRAAQKAGETSARRFRLVAHGVVAYGWNGVWGGWGVTLGGEDYAFDSVENDWKPLRGVFEGIVLVACAAADTGPDAQTKGSLRAGDGKFYCSRIASVTDTPVFAADAYQAYLRFVVRLLPWRGNVFRFDPNGPPVLIEKAGWVSGHGWEGWKGGAPPP